MIIFADWIDKSGVEFDNACVAWSFICNAGKRGYDNCRLLNRDIRPCFGWEFSGDSEYEEKCFMELWARFAK